MEQINQPKERNWLQRTFNFGGPGWFHDVVEMEMHLDTDNVIRHPEDPYLMPYSEYGECATYKIDDKITGVVSITSPPDAQVWITEVLVNVEQFAQFQRSVDGYQLAYRECVIPGTENGLLVAGTVELPFELDLKDVYPHGCLRPTYTGVALLHPPARRGDGEAALVRLRLRGAPPRAPPADMRGAQGEPRQAQRPRAGHAAAHVLPLTDLNGECVLDYKTNCFNVEGRLSGLVSFRKLATPVKFVKIELIKVEWSQQESMDTAIWTNVLFPPKAKLSESGWLKNKVVRLEPDEDGEQGPEVIELVEADAGAGGPTFSEDVNFPVDLDFPGLKEARNTGRVLTPSYKRLDMGNIDVDDETDVESDDEDEVEAGVEMTDKAAITPDDAPAPKGKVLVKRGPKDIVDEEKIEFEEGVAETGYFLRLTAITETGQKSWRAAGVAFCGVNTNKIWMYQKSFVCNQRTIDIDI
ncbi:hypothetical protein JL720_1161 [Aureococcus anophagefferens]|nr:hypothetical protein JL720_1161 [Aureococcus anophagefferens]